MTKTKGQLEAEISDFITRFEKEYMGRGPLQIRTHLIENLVLVHLSGVLTPAEQQLVSDKDDHRGRDLVKQVRLELLHRAEPKLAAGVRDILRVPVKSFHTDISTRTGDKVFVFVMMERPAFPGDASDRG